MVPGLPWGPAAELLELFRQGDAVTQAVAMLLLAMSVASWVVILWKPGCCAARATSAAAAAFWQAPRSTRRARAVGAFDREALVLPLIAATAAQAPGTLAAAGDRSQQLTRVLRDALHRVLHKLQFGQVLLATVGSTAPFVGLLGTGLGHLPRAHRHRGAGQITIDKVAGPVGEALIMTAAGLAVAIPAVLGYNVFGRLIGRIEADLEGFARDLRELLTHAGAGLDAPSAASSAPRAPASHPADERDQRHAAGGRDAGAGGDLHHHRAAAGQLDPAGPAAHRRRASPPTRPDSSPWSWTGRPGLPERPAVTPGSWPSSCRHAANANPRPRSSCAPTRPCPTARWSKSWASPRRRG